MNCETGMCCCCEEGVVAEFWNVDEMDVDELKELAGSDAEGMLPSDTPDDA